MTDMGQPTLAAAEDAYGGVIVDSKRLPQEPAEFRERLRFSLAAWRAKGIGGVWVKLPLESSALVPELVAQGFTYHHAEKHYLMLTHWLRDTPSTLPRNASHQVGVGGFVMNDAGEVLVVQERHGPLRGSGVWKMPTGLTNLGEDLHVAATREVLEETGIRTTFEAVLTVRESHGLAFGKSDLFFVCALRAKPGQTQIKPCEVEIEDAKWVPLREFLQNPFMRGRPLYSKILDACEAWAEGNYKGLKAQNLDAGVFDPRMDLLLHPNIERELDLMDRLRLQAQKENQSH